MRRLVRDMTISHAEFARLLPSGLGGMPYRQSGLRVEASDGARRVTIVLSEEQSRLLGVLSLPSVTVTLESKGFDDGEWAHFLARFDRAFQRGGG